MSEIKEIHIRVRYPMESDAITLRTELDWTHDFEPVTVDENGRGCEFRIRSTRDTLAFKPVLQRDGASHWALGENYVAGSPSGHAVPDGSVSENRADGSFEIFPRFFDASGVTVSEPFTLASTRGATFAVRVCTPAGYGENTQRRHSVLYLCGGPTALFPTGGPADAITDPTTESATTSGSLRETVRLLDAFGPIEELIAVSVQLVRGTDGAGSDRAEFVRFLADELKPRIDSLYRTRIGADHTAVAGGGVGAGAALEVAWAYPQLFGKVACVAGRFEQTEELRGLVETQTHRPQVIFLDGGTSPETVTATQAWNDLLIRSGFADRGDLQHVAFPRVPMGSEGALVRAHLALQRLFAQPRPVASRPRAEAPVAGGRITVTSSAALGTVRTVAARSKPALGTRVAEAPRPKATAPTSSPTERAGERPPEKITDDVAPTAAPRKRAPRGSKKS